MAVLLDVADLLIASWEIGEQAARKLTSGLEPARIDGRYLVSIVGLGRVRARAGRVPLAPFTQINLRTYALLEETAVLFLRSWVTPPGMVVALTGGPVSSARIRSAPGLLAAPGVGIRIPYQVGDPVEGGPLGRHELGLHRRGRLRAFSVKRGPSEWREAAPLEARADPLLSLGLEPTARPTLLYTPSTTLEVAGRPRRVN